jgi:hypothetical protein
VRRREGGGRQRELKESTYVDTAFSARGTTREEDG